MWCKQHNFAGHLHPAMIHKPVAAVNSLLLKVRGSTGYGLVFFLRGLNLQYSRVVLSRADCDFLLLFIQKTVKFI